MFHFIIKRHGIMPNFNMHFLNLNNMKIWFSITLLMLCMVALSETAEDRTLNLQIGFDLTQGKNGAPSLRLRNYEDSQESNRRAVDEETDEEKKSRPAVRAESDSDTKESVEKKKIERINKDESSDNESDKSKDDDDSDGDNHKSTKGLRPGEYEPEENPKAHPKFEANSDSDSDSFKRRFKRSIGKFQFMKKRGSRGKKFKSIIRQTIPGF